MVVMVMAYKDGIDWRQVFELNSGLAMTARTGPFYRADPMRPDWVGQDIQARHLNQDCCVVYVGDAEAVAFNPFRRRFAISGLRPIIPVSLLVAHSPTDEIAERVVPHRTQVVKPFSVKMSASRPVVTGRGESTVSDLYGGVTGGYDAAPNGGAT